MGVWDLVRHLRSLPFLHEFLVVLYQFLVQMILLVQKNEVIVLDLVNLKLYLQNKKHHQYHLVKYNHQF